ncbi:MAG: ribosome biogenesis GTPase Der [candidate division Zixibacteria bacterium]|nr:ribosome biogenesis GTPase Der [candidate division Zixibacteria bacterium]
MSRPIVAIVGRPNVGKSTLFNRMIRQRKAIVDDRPGITRDRVYGDCSWNGRDFIVVDTGGFIPRSSELIPSLVTQQAQLAIDQSDLVLFVLDSKVGPQTVDEEIAQLLKRAHKRVVVAANKADSEKDIADTSDFYKLGLGEVCPVSANSGRLVGDLLDDITGSLPEIVEEETDKDSIRVAIIGRPNVGKSSIFNKLIGEKRQIVSDIPGTTRDSVDSLIEINGTLFNFIDTAGLKRKTRYPDVVEYYSSLRSIRAIERADIALAVIDSDDGVTIGDIKVAGSAEEMGRGMIFVANKWDLVKGMEQFTFSQSVYDKAPMLKYVPIIFTSAKTGKGLDKIIPGILEVERECQKRIGTSNLNRFLDKVVQAKHPPAKGGKFIKFYYITQAETRPPTFIIFCNFPKLIDSPYQRFIENRIRQEFGFTGAPLKVIFKPRSES